MGAGRRAVQRGSRAFVVATLVIASGACAPHHPYDGDRDRDHDRDRTQMRDAQGDVRTENRDDAGRYAHRAPPPDRSESPSPQPGPNYVWVPGHWSWDGNDFQWHSGEWTTPPTGYHQWMPGRWQQTGANNWVYVEGQWQ
jgi:hypothetical protein